MLGWGIIHAQGKTTELTISNWTELLYGMRDSSIINQLLHYQGGLITVNDPYICYVEKDEKNNVAFEFCPKCTWWVDSFVSKNKLIQALVTTPQIPELRMELVICESIYPKDVKLHMLFQIISGNNNMECFLVPVISKFSAGSFKHKKGHFKKGHPE